MVPEGGLEVQQFANLATKESKDPDAVLMAMGREHLEGLLHKYVEIEGYSEDNLAVKSLRRALDKLTVQQAEEQEQQAKWKGRRMSSNIEDRRGDTTLQFIGRTAMEIFMASPDILLWWLGRLRKGSKPNEEELLEQLSELSKPKGKDKD